MNTVEAMRRALSHIDGTVEPWAEHHYRDEAEDAIRILREWGYELVPSAAGFRTTDKPCPQCGETGHVVMQILGLRSILCPDVPVGEIRAVGS